MKALKIRIYPTKEQSKFLDLQFGAVRMVYNKALWIISHQYKYHNKSLNALHDIKKLLPIAKRSRKYSWLKEYDSMSLAESCRNLNKAYQKFFKHTGGYPNFKSKRAVQSSYHCTSVQSSNKTIQIPKISPIKARVHRKINGKLKSITLSKSPTLKYYASLLFDTGEVTREEKKRFTKDQIIGIDVGINNFITDSNGKKTDNPRFLKRASINLKRKQKLLSRKVKGSKNREKARILVAKCHEKIFNARNDFQHKLSKKIIDENQAIIIETLKVKNMMKNRKLSKHIGDVAWSSFVDKLTYKARDAGKKILKINKFFASSKRCSACKSKNEELSLKEREWICKECCTKHDRDINAAYNIKQEGIINLKAEGLSVSAN